MGSTTKTRCAVVGCGVIGPVHMDAITRCADAELVAVCDIIPERAETCATDYCGTPYADYREMLAAEKPDVVHNMTIKPNVYGSLAARLAGVPKIVSAEEIVSLPVRGAADVAKIQAGVVSKEGSETLNIRGGRGTEVTFFVDGVKVVGRSGSAIGVPQSAIQEQEMIIGSINARYGDAMSGIINITTKSGSPNFFGSLEGITSNTR